MAHGVQVEDDNGKTITIGGLRNDPACTKLLTAEDRICEASIFVKRVRANAEMPPRHFF